MIQNQITHKAKSHSASGDAPEDKEEEDKVVKRVRTAYDVQRAKLEKLMKDPSKPVFIPTPRNEKDPNKAPDFVYNASIIQA
jgi:hypothetical protein